MPGELMKDTRKDRMRRRRELDRRKHSKSQHEQAYGRFLPEAQRAGLALVEEDFSDPGPTGIHLVRIGFL
jgi:hypothetical protein